MLGRTDSRARALLMLLAFVLVAGSLGVRLAYWQVTRRDELAAMAVRQSSTRYEIPSARGSIYDRTGTVVLATSVSRDRLAANPKLLTPPAAGRGRGPPRDAARARGRGRHGPHGAHDLRPAVRRPRPRPRRPRCRTGSGPPRRATTPDLSGLLLEPEPVRVYPQPGGGPGTTLAAHVLGFVNREGAGPVRRRAVLPGPARGHGPRRRRAEGRGGQPRPRHLDRPRPGYPGQDLTLTLDASLQVAVEQELLAAWIADRAKRVSAVVMDPYTGEVVAYASYPSYDANDYQAIAATDPGRFVDPIVSTVYEPGSVFKMMTAIAALGRGTVTMKTRIVDSGRLSLDGGHAHVDDADHHAMGRMEFRDAVAYSRNVVAAKVALRLGKSTRESARILHDTWDRMGFGRSTGHRRRERGPGHRARPGPDPVAPDRPRERRLRPGHRRDADPAGPGLRRDGQRRDARPAAGREDDRQHRDPAGRPRTRDDARPLRRAPEAHEARPHRGRLLPQPHADPGVRRRGQDRHRPDLGRGEARTGRSTSSTTRSSASSAGAPATPTSSSRSGSRRARRPSSGSATSRCR